MKTIIRIHLLAAIGLLGLASFSSAQQMPQDNWRYDGLEFSGPDANKPLRSIAIGSGGVFVGYGDPATSIVQFQEGGSFVRQFGTFGYILGIACDSSSNVYVVDRGDSKVKAFSPTGTFLREWGSAGPADGQFSFQNTSRTTLIAVDRNDQIYVCDPGNTRVQVFDTNGNFLRKWGSPGSLPSEFPTGSPTGIGIAPSGLIYLDASVNFFGDRSKIFSPDGSFISNSNEYFTSPAISPDGLVSGSQSSLRILDSTLAVVFSDSNYLYGTSAAFSRRGDLFVTTNTKVRVYEREYSSVHNALVPATIPQPVVLSVAQRAGTSLLDIDYKIATPDNTPVSAALLGFLDGGNTLSKVIPMNTFVEGTAANVGASQSPNVEKRVTWNMATDWSVDFARIQIEALAKSSASPLGIHWITIPASDGHPAIEVSRKPIGDSDLLSLWYWFIASHDSGISFSNGVVKGAQGLFNMLPLTAGDAGTNSTGRLFAYERLGVRAITGAEIQRALAGNYGFGSVDANSVVREAVTTTNFTLGWGSLLTNYGSSGPTVSVGLSDVGQVAVGSGHCLLVKNDGTLWAVGDNSSGQLGDGTHTTRNAPVQVATGVAYAAAGSYHSMFVKTDGTLWATGYNGEGQLGDGTTETRNTPVQVAPGVANVAAGGSHTLFVKSDGTLWAMGSNNSGQLGDGTNADRNVPILIASDVSRVAAGYFHSLFVKADGTLWAMGANSNGELGDGTTTQRKAPVQVADAVSQVAACGYLHMGMVSMSHSLYVKTDGTLWAMGANSNGQLGDGTTIQRITPVQIGVGVSQVSAAGGYSSSHSLFVKTDRTLWAMGGNSYGQLGDGTTTDRLSPVQVASNIKQAAAGGSFTIAIVAAP